MTKLSKSLIWGFGVLILSALFDKLQYVDALENYFVITNVFPVLKIVLSSVGLFIIVRGVIKYANI